MSKRESEILELEQTILSLTAKLNRLKSSSSSMWGAVYNAFIDEGNDEEVSELWANRIAEIVKNWAIKQRSAIGQKLAETGEMPPYVQCLNDIILSFSPTSDLMMGLSIDTLQPVEKVAQVPPIPSVVPPVPPTDTQIRPPKMQRVNVPKPFSSIES